MVNIVVGRYENPEHVGWQGWVEDRDRTWILFIHLDGHPVLFPNRDPKTGRILDPMPDPA